VAACCLEGEHPGTQQFGANSAMHIWLQAFEHVDLTFRLTIASAVRDCVSDGGEIVPQLEVGACNECLSPLRHATRHRCVWVFSIR
jgi:hypothetical protein